MVEYTITNNGTFTASAGETYKITVKQSTAVSVSNDTDGTLYVSESGNFSSDGGIGEYIAVASGDALNNFQCICEQLTVYIKSDGAGIISIAGRGF